jgi:hypothetical protein
VITRNVQTAAGRIVANKKTGKETPTGSIRMDCTVARKRKEIVGKEMELIAQHD